MEVRLLHNTNGIHIRINIIPFPFPFPSPLSHTAPVSHRKPCCGCGWGCGACGVWGGDDPWGAFPVKSGQGGRVFILGGYRVKHIPRNGMDRVDGVLFGAEHNRAVAGHTGAYVDHIARVLKQSTERKGA